MGFLKKIKFWKKRNNTLTKVDGCVSTEDPRTSDTATMTNNNTPTKVDACVSTEDPRTCDAATMTNNNTPTKVDACVNTDVPGTCDAATVSMDPTVMCATYTQTETRMDGGGGDGAMKDKYERELEMTNKKIRELEEELVVSKRLTADLMLNIRQRDRANTDEKKTVRRLEDKNDREPYVRRNRHSDHHLAEPPRDNRDWHPRHFSRQKPIQHPYGNRS